MTGSYIRKFSPNFKHIAAVVFLTAGSIFLIIGVVKYIKISNAKPIENIHLDLKKGSYVSFTLENVISAKTQYNDEKYPLQFLHKDSRSADLTKSSEDYCIYAAERYRFLTADGGVTPDVYSILENGDFIGADNKERYIGYVTDDDAEDFLDYMKIANRYHAGFFLGGSDAEVGDFIADNCSRYGIRITDEKKEKRKWLFSVPFLAVGIFLMVSAGNPFFYIPEDTPEIENSELHKNLELKNNS